MESPRLLAPIRKGNMRTCPKTCAPLVTTLASTKDKGKAPKDDLNNYQSIHGPLCHQAASGKRASGQRLAAPGAWLARASASGAGGVVS
eukprot:scaffold5938_cov122-Isochrysis_galbana.AAC.2